MLFKKKEKIVAWKKNGDFFTLFINNKAIKGDIVNCWVGNHLLVIVEKLKKYYLLQNYANQQDDVIKEAEYIANIGTLLWSKSGDGYYLYDNCELVQEDSIPIDINDLQLASYNDNAYLLRDYSNTEDDVLKELTLISEPEQVHWIKIDDHFHILNGGELMNVNHQASYCKDDLLVYLEQLKALFLMNDYENAEEYLFYKAIRIAEKDEFIWRKVKENSFNLFRNQETYHSNSKATFHNDDAIAYVPNLDSSFFLGDLRNGNKEDYYGLEPLSSNVYWSGYNKTYSLIVNGDNIASRIGTHNSWIDDDLLIYDPETSVTYLFQDFATLQDDKLREAEIVSRSAKTVWKAYNNQFWIWHEGIKTGKCEHQMMGDDLMAMPTELQTMFQLQNFRNCQDDKLRCIE